MRLKVAGSTTMPVKIGTNSHTRATKNRNESRLANASPTANRYSDHEHGNRAHERAGGHESEQRHELDPRIESLQQTRRRRDLLGEDRPADQIRRALHRLRHEAALAAAPDAAARAETDLRRQQPVGGEPGPVPVRPSRRSYPHRVGDRAGARRVRAGAERRTPACTLPYTAAAMSSVPITADA